MSSFFHFAVAGTHSGVGKTTVATALMAALGRRGCRVQPFKAGPDFIDPLFHSAAAGRPGRNLDGWMLSRETNIDMFETASAGADAAVVEGMMGLFDGYDGRSESGSTAELAKWLDMPVVLVVDASAAARSIAAVVRGFETFDADVRLAGVIFNRVAGDGHYAMLRDAVMAHSSVAVLGYLPENASVRTPERHLGLVIPREPKWNEWADWIEQHLDIQQLVDLAGRREAHESRAIRKATLARIGVARDEAFCFYYQDNLDLLSRYGAELIEFSPLSDERLPDDLDGLYLGGGYPEMHAEVLSGNRSMRAAVREFAESAGPIYAECGGLMYLTEAIVDTSGVSHQMTGVFPTRARMHGRLAAIGYVEVETGDGKMRGHEFRYSSIDEMPGWVPRRYRIRPNRCEGYAVKSVLASYVHLHFGSSPAFAERFVAQCADRKKARA